MNFKEYELVTIMKPCFDRAQNHDILLSKIFSKLSLF